MTAGTITTRSSHLKDSDKNLELLIPTINKELKPAAQMGFNACLEGFELALNTCQKALQNAAREKTEQRDKEPYIAAMEICQIKHAELVDDFRQNLLSAYSILTNQKDAVAESGFLVKESAKKAGLQSNVNVNSRFLQQKIIADDHRFFEKEISASTAALKHSLNKLEVNNHNNPFGPNVIIECCYKTLANGHFSQGAIQALLLHFQQVWLSQLKKFYSQIIELLRLRGATAKKTTPFKPTPQNTSSSTFKLNTVDAEVFSTASAFTNNKHATAINIIDAVTLIQDAVIPPTLHQTTYRSLASTAPENSHVLPTHAVAQLVNDMQKGYEPIGDGDVIRYIRQQLRLKTVGEQAVTISQHDENTINLVSLCFRAIAAPLSKSLAPLILRLKPVYARVALNDDFFFHDTSHPAHRLLDQILKLINSNFNDKAIRRYVTTVVMKVQLKFTDDITLFDKLLDEIDVYFADEKLRYQENQFDLVQKFSDKENQQKSIALCDKYLQNLIDTLSSKLNFFEFFKAILNPVLVQKYLQYGEMSDEWKAIDKHIQHIFSMLACEDIDILRKQIKNSANANIQLGQLLSGAGVSVTNTDMLLAQLQDIQVLQMQGKTLSDIKSPQLAHYQPMRKFLLSHQQGNQGNFVSSFIGYHHSQLKAAKFARIHPLIIDSEAEDIVRSLTVGNWLSMLVDQKVMRLQLGFYSKTTEHFVFFDGDHKKTFERSTDELERDFSSGFACRIEYTANFDTALVEVSKSLSLRAPSPR